MDCNEKMYHHYCHHMYAMPMVPMMAACCHCGEGNGGCNPGGNSSISYCKIVDEKPSGTHGGVFQAGAWLTRTLNTIQNNDNDIVSLNNNQITLPAGTYIFSGSAPTTQVDLHKCRLQNISDNQTVALGTSENGLIKKTGDGDYINTRSFVSGKFTISSPAILELQHYCISADTVATGQIAGFGGACSFPDVNEIYSVIEFWKIG